MRSTLLAITLGLLGTATALAAQVTAQTEGPGLKAGEDARDKAILQYCHKPPPPPPNFRGRRPQARRARGLPPAQPVTAIPGVIAAGRHWKIVWHEEGNNADGIIADGNDILVAQQDNSDVVRVSPSGHATVVYRDTNTGGALSRNKQGQLFIVERGYLQSIDELAPDHKVLANEIHGDSLDCLGMGGLNDLTAAANGGAYFTLGNLYYAAPDGTVTRQGTVTGTNGIILSPDEKTLYVTSGGFGRPANLVAFDVQPDGTLTNQRNFALLPGGGDGSTIDSEGRIYVSSGGGVEVISPDGQSLGHIPGPRGAGIISLAFGGPGKHTLYAVALYQGMGKAHRGLPSDEGRLAQAGVLASIPMLSQGYADRAK